MKLLEWLKFKVSKEQRLIRKALALSGKDRAVIVLDKKTEMLTFALNGRVIPMRAYKKGSETPLPIVSHLLNNNKRGHVMVDFLRYVDSAIYNLTMSDEKIQKKISKLNQGEDVQFGVKTELTKKLFNLNKLNK